MRKITTLTIYLFISQFTLAQSSSVAGIVNQIEIQEDTIISVFNWVTDNIVYDVAKLNDLKKGKKTAAYKDISNQEEFIEYKLEKVITRKMGVCQDYSILFDAIVKKFGYESNIIEGYTKDEKGRIQWSMGHTWNAVKVDGIWKLYDPTWGAGYVTENRKFVKNYSKKWLDISPEEMIKTHMPFDPMWQLSNAPINYQDFKYNTNTLDYQDKYRYEELITSHFLKDHKERMYDQIKRSQNIGDGGRLTEEWKKNTISQIDHYELSNQSISLEEANNIMTESTNKFNDYIKAKNKQFKGKKWTRAYSRQNLQQLKEDVTSVLIAFNNVEVNDSKFQRSLNQSISHTEKFLQRIELELKYLNKTTI